jgi:fatty-acyl-CoA synthase
MRTPTRDSLPRRFADFQTLGQALDYAAHGGRGLNFHDARGRLVRGYTFKDLRTDASALAARLIAHGIKPGARVSLIAETSPEFAAAFFGACYAGAWPVPLPLPTSFGGGEGYIEQLAHQLKSSDSSLLLYPSDLSELASAAAILAGTDHCDWEKFGDGSVAAAELPAVRSQDVAYLQYSSGSTRFPQGIEITHRALLANLAAQSRGLQFAEDDRVISWLPFYHDMGLVGCLLCLVANQVSTDYLKTEDFARRPLSWLDLISRNEGTSISFSPTFGYDICARRVSSQTSVHDRFDLSRWRVAGNGADMIRPEVMQEFVDKFSEAGFDARSFVPSYGLAEATLVVTFMPLKSGISVELVDERLLSGDEDPSEAAPRFRPIVDCGAPVEGMEVAVRDDGGQVVAESQIGRVFCRGSSVMSGYFRDELATVRCLSNDGWLDTGDMGFVSGGHLFIVGRAKDMIIVNGKNYWPQDIEWAVEQLPGFKAGDVAAFAVTGPDGEERAAVLVQCRISDPSQRELTRATIRSHVLGVSNLAAVVELVPPRSLPRTTSGKLSRTKARLLYLSGEMQRYSATDGVA